MATVSLVLFDVSLKIDVILIGRSRWWRQRGKFYSTQDANNLHVWKTTANFVFKQKVRNQNLKLSPFYSALHLNRYLHSFLSLSTYPLHFYFTLSLEIIQNL